MTYAACAVVILFAGVVCSVLTWPATSNGRESLDVIFPMSIKGDDSTVSLLQVSGAKKVRPEPAMNLTQGLLSVSNANTSLDLTQEVSRRVVSPPTANASALPEPGSKKEHPWQLLALVSSDVSEMVRDSAKSGMTGTVFLVAGVFVLGVCLAMLCQRTGSPVQSGLRSAVGVVSSAGIPGAAPAKEEPKKKKGVCC
eukprot:TRINITY_DN34556_c0_g1_i1.p2 TRINITY_DN34556_c0_g1~~TRINITY_DN34556_c0_g1_i1.p2  ORF type:complete len:197 (+),score=28.62 TRINITY_DN34556_c0_g1_i1:92-682(+)